MAKNALSKLSDLTVGGLCSHGLCSDVVEVREDTPFSEIVDAIRNGPPFHSVVVVDSDRCVVGRVSVEHLYEAVIVDILPEQALASATDLESTMEVAVEVRHNRAREIMEEPQIAKATESVPHALGRIFRESLKGLVVTEESGVLIGYLDRMTIISHWPEFTAARASQP